MEREFKWTAGRADFDRLCAVLSAAGPAVRLDMQAVYYDTPDRMLRDQRIGLRLRRENGAGVCCMKLRSAEAANGLHAHAEYECPAETLAQGLRALPAQGADPALCAALAAAPLAPVCRVDFVRTAQLVSLPGCTAELSFDAGTLAAGAASAPLSEIELEYKSGDLDGFLSAGSALAAAHHLVPQPLSKLARALQLSEMKKPAE